jgi:hypothetical protein
VLYDTGVQPFEEWDEFEPHPRPKKAWIAVRGIAAKWNAVTPNVSLDVGPSRAEHGANPVAVEDWKDAQVPRARAPEDAHEHGLGSVVGMMPSRDSLCAGERGGGSQGLPPSGPRARLQVAARRDDDPRPIEWHLEGTREGLRQVQLSRSLDPEAVVDPVSEQPECPFAAEQAEDMEQRHRVGSAADRNEHRRASADESVVAHGGAHEGDQRGRMGSRQRFIPARMICRARCRSAGARRA